MAYSLTNDEYNVLNKIASQTKMDCWFSLDTDEDGSDYVFDLEHDRELTLQAGVAMLNDGIVPDMLDLTAEEAAVYDNLLQKMDIVYYPIDGEQEIIDSLPKEFDFHSKLNHFVPVYHAVEEDSYYVVTAEGFLWHIYKGDIHRRLLNGDYVIIEEELQ